MTKECRFLEVDRDNEGKVYEAFCLAGHKTCTGCEFHVPAQTMGPPEAWYPEECRAEGGICAEMHHQIYGCPICGRHDDCGCGAPDTDEHYGAPWEANKGDLEGWDASTDDDIPF